MQHWALIIWGLACCKCLRESFPWPGPIYFFGFQIQKNWFSDFFSIGHGRCHAHSSMELTLDTRDESGLSGWCLQKWALSRPTVCQLEAGPPYQYSHRNVLGEGWGWQEKRAAHRETLRRRLLFNARLSAMGFPRSVSEHIPEHMWEHVSNTYGNTCHVPVPFSLFLPGFLFRFPSSFPPPYILTWVDSDCSKKKKCSTWEHFVLTVTCFPTTTTYMD